MKHPLGNWNTSDGSHRATPREILVDIAFIAIVSGVLVIAFHAIFDFWPS